MKTDLSAAMTAGVFVEFFDADGHCVGQAAFADWFGKPVPAMGDRLVCPVTHSPNAGGAARKLAGRVRARHVDIQRDEQGRPCVWVRLEVDVIARSDTARRKTTRTDGGHSRSKEARPEGSHSERSCSNSPRSEQAAEPAKDAPRRPLFDIWFSNN